MLENENIGTVFATDAILSTLMCCPRSMYSWDIVIQRVGNKLFLDKRDASFDLLTVSSPCVLLRESKYVILLYGGEVEVCGHIIMPTTCIQVYVWSEQ